MLSKMNSAISVFGFLLSSSVSVIGCVVHYDCSQSWVSSCIFWGFVIEVVLFRFSSLHFSFSASVIVLLLVAFHIYSCLSFC